LAGRPLELHGFLYRIILATDCHVCRLGRAALGAINELALNLQLLVGQVAVDVLVEGFVIVARMELGFLVMAGEEPTRHDAAARLFCEGSRASQIPLGLNTDALSGVAGPDGISMLVQSLLEVAEVLLELGLVVEGYLIDAVPA